MKIQCVYQRLFECKLDNSDKIAFLLTIYWSFASNQSLSSHQLENKNRVHQDINVRLV